MRQFVLNIAILIYVFNVNSQCIGNNTFLGTTNANWHVATNWSAGCVPTVPVLGNIIIASNCVFQDLTDFQLNFGANVTVNNGVAFTIKNGDPSQALWTCGDILNYAGQNYQTTQMGTQCWMAKNLNIGSLINSDVNQTNNNVVEKFCLDDNPANCIIYGGLYQWNEAMAYTTTPNAQGLCPAGWHMASELDFNILEENLPELDKGSRLASNTNLWENGALKASAFFASSGFNALPGGMGEDDSTLSENFNAFFWSSTFSGNVAFALGLNFDNTNFFTKLLN